MSMAIKYRMMKKNKRADGGMCEHGSKACEMCHGGKMAEGGFVGEEKASGYADEDMVGRIIRSRMQSYSKGGRVSNDTPIIADFEENQFDDLVKDDDLEQHYTGANSGDEIGNEQEDEDRRDIVSRIMKSRKKKDKMPNPM